MLKEKLASETYKTPSPGGFRRPLKKKSPYHSSKSKSRSKASDRLKTQKSVVDAQVNPADDSLFKADLRLSSSLSDHRTESLDRTPGKRSSFDNQSTQLEDTEKADHNIMQELLQLRQQVETLSKSVFLANSASRPADVALELDQLRRENADLKKRLETTPKAKSTRRRSLSKKKILILSKKPPVSRLSRSKSKKRLCNHCLFLMSKGFPSALCQKHNSKRSSVQL